MGWDESWGTFADNAEQNRTAATACCACGGGQVCQDSPLGWADRNGNGCAAYAARGWCSGDSSPGPGWPSAWGSFADQGRDGHTAASACCACRPPAVDVGGRGCDYYALHPTHCGCCDDEDFVAQLACADVCAAGGSANGSTLSERTAGWPNDTRLIIFRSGHSMGRLRAEDWPVRFPHLQVVRLTGASLTGTLPPELGLLAELRLLSFNLNSLQGTLPPQLGQLTRLQTLSVGSNLLRGPVPRELGNLTELRCFVGDSNGLTGTLPSEVGMLANLVTLSVSNNSLAGALPSELGAVTKLQSLDLSSNRLTGTLPSELGLLANLVALSVSANSLAGTLPSELSSLANLQSLDISGNHLTGTLPSQLGMLANLVQLVASTNSLAGTLPIELGALANLQYLDLSTNSLAGTLPIELGALANLQYLDLSTNSLAGTLPSELGALANLQTLWLHENSFRGTVPSELGGLTDLQYLDLSDNNLTGTLPSELGSLASLVQLALASNSLSGTLPSELGGLTNLQELSLYHNNFTGTLPSELGDLSALRFLGAFGNALHGTLPRWLGDLSQLETLQFNGNNFVGTLPAELGKLGHLRWLELEDNMLTGSVPRSLGQLAQLERLILQDNALTGAVPEGVGSLSKLVELRLKSNNLTALPRDFARLQALELLDVSENPRLGGTFPDTSRCLNLQTIGADGCGFTDAGAVGRSVELLSFPGNRLTFLPEAWTTLSSVSFLNLQDNRIATWRPHEVWRPGFMVCSELPTVSRLDWPAMEMLYLSGNPLGGSITFRDFIWSLAYLPTLFQLVAARCGLRGEMLPEVNGGFGADMEGDQFCQKVPIDRGGFPYLAALDLSENNITRILVPPPPLLNAADLHSNALAGRALHAGWFSIASALDFWGNPDMRESVVPPHRLTGCPAGGSSELEANPYGWQAGKSEDPFECTTLCPGLPLRYTHDSWLNVSSLCRCEAGWGGSAVYCSRCPANTFSHTEDAWLMVRTCRPCPALSTTDPGVENATGVEQCKCATGWYMGAAPQGQGAANKTAGASTTSAEADAGVPACVPCRQWPVQSSPRGATRRDQCFCDPVYDGLRSILGSCGCADGAYMDHRARKCRPCNLLAERCSWGAEVDHSLSPPVIRAAYWAEPPPDVELGDSNFSGNDIWRCVSRETCREGGACAAGRVGRACSLCEGGLYGSPDGECRPCPQGPAETRRALLWAALLVGPSAALAAHVLLEKRKGEQARGAAGLLSSLGTSVKQLLKYIQLLGVLSTFSVRWPPAARQFLTDITRITVALPQVAGAACLTGQQTASVEMAFRWLLPVAGIAGAFFAALLLLPVRRCKSRSGWHGRMIMGRWDAVRVSQWGLVLFYSTLLQYGTVVLTCARSPNGKLTVVAFPHLECGGVGEWAWLAVASCVFLFVFVLLVYSSIFAAWRQTTHALIESRFASRGWWAFLFEDYRHGWMHWLMLAMLKDVVLVAIATAWAGDGTSQLLATAAASTWYAHLVLRDQPFRSPPNSLVEAWTAMSMAVLCVVGAGLGYQSPPGADLYAEVVGDALEDRGAQAMVVVLWLTLVGPVTILFYQVIATFQKVTRRLPRCLRPRAAQDREVWHADFCDAFGLTDETAPLFRGVLQRFDAVDEASFRRLMGASVATVGVVRTTVGGVHGAARMSCLARSSPTFMSAANANQLPKAGADEAGDGADAGDDVDAEAAAPPPPPADAADDEVVELAPPPPADARGDKDDPGTMAAMANALIRPESVQVANCAVVIL